MYFHFTSLTLRDLQMQLQLFLHLITWFLIMTMTVCLCIYCIHALHCMFCYILATFLTNMQVNLCVNVVTDYHSVYKILFFITVQCTKQCSFIPCSQWCPIFPGGHMQTPVTGLQVAPPQLQTLLHRIPQYPSPHTEIAM